MKRHIKKEFKDKYISLVHHFSLTDKLEILDGIIRCRSFSEHQNLFIDDPTPFTIKDYEYIIWIAFVELYQHVDDPPITFHFNQKMTLGVFESEAYSLTLMRVMAGIGSKDHLLYGYTETKRKELIAAQRMSVINNIIKS